MPFRQCEVIGPEGSVAESSEETAFPFLLRLPSLETECQLTALGGALGSALVLRSLTFLLPFHPPLWRSIWAVPYPTKDVCVCVCMCVRVCVCDTCTQPL